MHREYLLWDHDGVLVDTERWYFEATKAALARFDVALSKDTYLEFMTAGRSCWDLARARGVDAREIAARRVERDTLYRQFLGTLSIEIDGLAPVLEELESRHRMAVVTTYRAPIWTPFTQTETCFDTSSSY